MMDVNFVFKTNSKERKNLFLRKICFGFNPIPQGGCGSQKKDQQN